MKYLVFSHGFGVRKDDRGLLTDIAAAFPNYKSVLFDYNEIDEKNNVLTVRPLSKQAEMLNEHIRDVRIEDPSAEVTLVCHSQGCVAAALAAPIGISKVIFLTPPGKVSRDRIKKFFGQRPGAYTEENGTMVVPRRDGSTTRIPKAFTEDKANMEVPKLYAQLASQTNLTVINANQEDVLPPTDFSFLDSIATVESIDGDHNFTGESRKSLIEKLKRLFP